MRGARRALFGGSFDPVHFGHLLVAEQLRESERLEAVIFVPARRSPHKRGTGASAAHRLAMLRRALRGNAAFGSSDLEIRRRGPSFTIDTVRGFARAWGERPALLLGGDALLELHTWKESEALLREARIVVYARPGAERAAARARELGLAYHAGVLSPLSSSALRQRARRGLSLRYQVPEPVRRYILAERLYRGRRRNGA
jgi:nicotinate-nucleotide adenylyltransferase